MVLPFYPEYSPKPNKSHAFTGAGQLETTVGTIALDHARTLKIPVSEADNLPEMGPSDIMR